MIRSFLAIEIPQSVLGKIREVQEELGTIGADIKWVEPENIHLTLKFFGNIEETSIDLIIKSAEEVMVSFAPFTLKVKDIGGFPNLKNPRVIWVGIVDNEKILSKFHKMLESRFEKIGFRGEDRAFQPHLTLGRVRSARGKAELIKRMEKFKGNDFGEFEVDKVVLFKSDLTKEGPIYTPLKEVRFKS